MDATLKPCLTTSSLGIGYPVKEKDITLFSDLNLVLNAGELVCFMGPNGIGKSSLIRTLCGLQKPINGKIDYGVPETERSSQVAVVLTERINAANMTVGEVVTFGRYPYLNWSIRLQPNDEYLIDEALSKTHIEHLRNKKISELSDGQMQMVMIARALAQDTKIILLDEPTAHLDLNNRVEIMNLLRTICRTMNKAILVATHELDLALQTADLIWLAGKNQKIKTGIPEDLVLDGSFDEIFQFKGFDLKTGKVYHESYRNIQVSVLGNGPEVLWTKNAIERSGCKIVEDGKISVSLKKSNEKLVWVLTYDELTEHHSIQDLLKAILSIDCKIYP